MRDSRNSLLSFIEQELAKPVSAPVNELAEAARLRHGASVAAVLFYGSCLRREEASLAEGLLDFYLLVDDYGDAYGGRALPAFANFLLPPNVFYLEMPLPAGHLRCKYAIMSMRQFARACTGSAWNVSIWARFSQPARLIWARSPREREVVAAACVDAMLTMVGNSPALAKGSSDAGTIWMSALEQTYLAELRSEGSERARSIVEADLARYEAVTPWCVAELSVNRRPPGEPTLALTWLGRRVLGKTLNVLRLVKAAFTFEGGLDYILWKVKRHSGVEIPVSDWQRRHPLLAAPTLAWQLYRRGAFR